MKFERTNFADLVIVHSQPHRDERGYFTRTFCEKEFAAAGLKAHFPQTSLSFSARAGTVRGMHFQKGPFAETKLVRCSKGAVFDVVVDLRKGEPTFRKWRGFELSAHNGTGLYVPEGFAHGFQTLTDETEVTYAITPAFVPGVADGVRWSDPAIDIRWPRPISVISERDCTWPLVSEQS